MRRLAQSACAEWGAGAVSPALLQAAKGDVKHAERDLLSLFRSYGMSLEVPISHYHFGPVCIAHLKVRKWWTYLLRSRSTLVFGGFDRRQQEAELAMQCFWKNYKANVPDHKIFNTHADRLQHCLPFYLFLDEGVGLRKTGVLVISLQVVLGNSTAKNFVEARHKLEATRRGEELDPGTLSDLMAKNQSHSAAGRTYDSRFLYTVLPKKLYKKNNLVNELLDKLADEIIDVMKNGVQVGSTVYYPVCLGVKGDAPMLMRVGNFVRGFSRMGKDRGCCWECQAGEAGHHFEDCRKHPDWESSLYTVRPYSEASPLLRIPSQSIPERFFNRDPFHTFKQSIGCSFVSSSIVTLGELGYFAAGPGESTAVEAMLQRSYNDFGFWCKHEWPGRVMNSLKQFTKDTFHWGRRDMFPAGRYKGSDTMLLVRWLQHCMIYGFVSFQANPPSRSGQSPVMSPLQEWHAPILEKILNACGGGLNFFQIIHRNGIWLSQEKTRDLKASAIGLTSSFSALASTCQAQQMPRYHLVPSLHAMHHFYIDAKRFLEMRPRPKFSYSPGVLNCEADEDFVGKVARLTRKVHALSTTQRTLERYCVKWWCESQDLR